MANSANSTNSSFNIISNNEHLSEAQKKALDSAKSNLLDALDLGNKVKFLSIGDISIKLKNLINGKGSINFEKVIKTIFSTLNLPIKVTLTEEQRDEYGEDLGHYLKASNETEQKKIIKKLAEKIILDQGQAIDFGKDKSSDRNSREAYEELNKIQRYSGKIELIQQLIGEDIDKHFIIKRKEEDLKAIQAAEIAIKDITSDVDKEEQIKNLKDKLNNEEEKKDSPKESKEDAEKEKNYVSRAEVAKDIKNLRKDSDFPAGSITIKGITVRLSEFEFYEEIKQDYINAKGDTKSLAKLDKELAELVIISLPKDSEFEKRFQIKLEESEISEGLSVSRERLARYGMAVDYFEYSNTVIERDYTEILNVINETKTTIETINKEISELTVILTEISDESKKKEIIEQISKRREELNELFKKQKKLIQKLNEEDSNSDDLNKLEIEKIKLENEIKRIIEDREGTLRDEFDEKLKKHSNWSKKGPQDDGKGIYVNGHRYQCEFVNNATNHNPNRTPITVHRWKDGEIIKSADLDNEWLPTDDIDGKTDGKKIRKLWEDLRSEYIQQGIESFKLNDDEYKSKISQLKNINKRINQLKSDDLEVKIKELSDSLDLCGGGETIIVWTKAGTRCTLQKTGNKYAIAENNTDIKFNEHLDPDSKGNSQLISKETLLQLLESEADDIDYISIGQNQEKKISWVSSNSKKNKIYQELLETTQEGERITKTLQELESLLQNSSLDSQTIISLIEELRINIQTIEQSFSSFESFSSSYKEIIETLKYGIYKARNFVYPKPDPDPDPDPVKGLELNAVISDMGTDVFREKAALKVEEELKKKYKSLGGWQVISRAALFFGRGKTRKKMLKAEMDNIANTAFLTDNAYAALNEQSQNAADRHSHEKTEGLEEINAITTVHNAQVDQLCKDYLNGVINDAQFQQQFNTIIAADTNVQNALNGQNITHIGTNILLKLKEQRATNDLIQHLDADLNSYINDPSRRYIYLNNMKNRVNRYIKDYQKDPTFMADFEQFAGGDLNARNRLEKFLSHQKAIMKMQITNLTMNIDILNKGKSAYQIDNKDREKGWKYKVGHFLDKLPPWGTVIGSTALAVGLGFATGGLGAVAGAAVTTGVFGAYVGTTNAIKKWTHHTKEQNTHEKNLITDYRNEQARIQNWQNIAQNGHGWRKYKAKRQLALYDQTSHENIMLSRQISEDITNLAAKIGPLSANEQQFMKANLIEGWARFQFHKQNGHNFLASENVDETEKDMRALEKAITLGLHKLSGTGTPLTTNDIETSMTASSSLRKNITYDVIKNDLQASYDKSLIQFKRERRNLSLKYGIGTAALSIGTAVGMQAIFKTGMFAKGTPEIPGTPGETISHTASPDNFGLGGYELSNSNIYNTTYSAVSNAPEGSNIIFSYGVGTDATRVLSGHLTDAELASKISEVAGNINAMDLATSQKNSLLGALEGLKHTGFTNDNLASMRAAESLEHFARGISDSGRTDLVLKLKELGSVAGGNAHDASQRFMKGVIDVVIPGTEGIHGTPPPRRGRRFMGMPLFFNTFKDRDSSASSLDQARGGNTPKKSKKNPKKEKNKNNP